MITRLTGVTAIADLAGDRISWFARVRGDAGPAVVLNVISAGRMWTHDGPDGLDHPRLQVDSYGETELQAVALARAVRTELEQAADVALPGGVVWRFHPAMQDGEGWAHEGEQDGGAPLFRVSRDYFLYHQQF